MKEPKKIYLPDPENMLIWRENENDIINRKLEYISVNQLREWIEQNKKNTQPILESLKNCVDVFDLEKFINEP